MRDARRLHSSCGQNSSDDSFILLKRDSAQLSNQQLNILFISGGAGGHNTCLNSVERYEIRTNSWTSMPPLSVGRMNHAMCAIGDSIIVFCGTQDDGSETSSIEMLKCTRIQARWQMIQISSLLPRFSLGVAPINSREVAILGGYSNGNTENQEGQKLSDILIFHV